MGVLGCNRGFSDFGLPFLSDGERTPTPTYEELAEGPKNFSYDKGKFELKGMRCNLVDTANAKGVFFNVRALNLDEDKYGDSGDAKYFIDPEWIDTPEVYEDLEANMKMKAEIARGEVEMLIEFCIDLGLDDNEGWGELDPDAILARLVTSFETNTPEDRIFEATIKFQFYQATKKQEVGSQIKFSYFKVLDV